MAVQAEEVYFSARLATGLLNALYGPHSGIYAAFAVGDLKATIVSGAGCGSPTVFAYPSVVGIIVADAGDTMETFKITLHVVVYSGAGVPIIPKILVKAEGSE